MVKGSIPRGHKTLTAFVAMFLIALITGCAQAAPTATPTQAPKAAPAREAKPAAVAATPSTKEAKPEAKAATPAAKATAPAAQLVKLKSAFSAMSGSQAPLWVAKEKGLFEKYGLDITLDYIATGGVLTAALLSGETAIASTAGGAQVSANLAGGETTIIAGFTNMVALSLYVQPSIQRIEDLKGKTVGVTRFGANSDFSTRYALRKYGLEPEKDVAIVQTGGLPESVAALQSGGIHGAALAPPTSVQAKKLGMRELINFVDLEIPYAQNTLAVNKKYLASNRGAVLNYMKAFVDGIALAKKDKDYTKKVVGQYSKIEDQDILEETWQLYTGKLLPRVPYETVEAVQAVLDDLAREDPRAKTAKPETFIDNSLLKELDDSGFIKKLYGE